MELGSTDHFFKIYKDLPEEQVKGYYKIRTAELLQEIELLKQENMALSKEINLSKNLKNFMVDGFDIDNPYDYR